MKFSQIYTGQKSKQALSRARKTVAASTEFSAAATRLSAEELKSEFRALAKTALSKRAPYGFALVREAARRTLGMSHFDVQLVGATVLLDKRLAEMRTGEGKTLTITAPAALLALDGLGVHVVTANAYLARRDAELMRPVYEALGLTVSTIYAEQTTTEKQAAYRCDIVYGVGSEFGFDYLKDHLVRVDTDKVQRLAPYAAIVDEIDSVLIDEARVPLIISRAAADRTEMVRTLDACVKTLTAQKHYNVNLKDREADVTEAGYAAVEAFLVDNGVLADGKELYAISHLSWVRQLHSSVKAYALFKRDRDYVSQGGELVLVDVGTGRTMQGRRFEDGLHEALEAKEGLKVLQGTVTKATITYQNYFSRYPHLCGLTGTAMTDAEEFMDLYNLEVVSVPTNKPLLRVVLEDQVYGTKSEKFDAVVQAALAVHKTGQPLLVGCAFIRDADVLDRIFTKAGLPHETLTAKHVEREAHIIANAGRLGAVTIATNMAGRGTDILLGGEKPTVDGYADAVAFEAAQQAWRAERDAVIHTGGLRVLGTERNGLRRVDNQLAGRSGRQGDPGAVQFLLSLEDELLKVFGQSKQLIGVQRALRTPGAALGGAVIGKLVEYAQRNVEGQGFTARKDLMQFDAALSEQRQAVFDLRDDLLVSGTLDYALACANLGVQQWAHANLPLETMPETWPIGALKKDLLDTFGLDAPLLGWVSKDEFNVEEIREKLMLLAQTRLASLNLTEEQTHPLVFDTISEQWEDQLAALAELRENVSLKGNTGFNAIFQFHKDAFELFKVFEKETNHRLASALLKKGELEARHAQNLEKTQARSAFSVVALELEKRWVSRNDLCPCGSGLRFKACHGKLDGSPARAAPALFA
jgi:preprotein translocase subunit SecA